MPNTIKQTLLVATEQLENSSDTARLDAEVLLAHVMKKTRTWLMTWPEHTLTSEEEKQFHGLLQQRIDGKPIAYLIGEQEFWSVKLKVNEHTLIPRPETECLVEQALTLIPIDAKFEIADLGTGSGAIALVIAKERPTCHITAIEQSADTIAVAQENAKQLRLANITFLQANWLVGVEPDHFDLILSNPPYIEITDPHLQQGDVRFEPPSALQSGVDGLNDIRQIITQAKYCLKGSGWLLIEHGYRQQQAIMALLHEHGFHHIQGFKDYAVQPRFVMAQKP